jgi:hypothetical protein
MKKRKRGKERGKEKLAERKETKARKGMISGKRPSSPKKRKKRQKKGNPKRESTRDPKIKRGEGDEKMVEGKRNEPC